VDKRISTNEHSDDIFAVASGYSQRAPIVIIRLSGANCQTRLEACLSKPINTFKPSCLKLVDFIDPNTETVIDTPMIAIFKTPHSYTGENTVELHFHGSSYIIQRVSKCLLSLGFRSAQAGEFTQRAYENGKIDLIQAEGLHGLIDAKTQHEWSTAKYLMGGQLQQSIDLLKKDLIKAMSYLEAVIDFPEEDDVTQAIIERADITIDKVLDDIKNMSDTYASGRIASQGLKIVIIGKPNAGKSTLLNTLLDKERAIISPQAGTTRDYIEESIIIGGHLVKLFDTAGIRDSQNQIETMGIAKTHELKKNADLVLSLHAADSYDISNIKNNDKNVINIITKIDKDPNYKKLDGRMAISCKSFIGISDLKKTISNYIEKQLNFLNNKVYISSQRQFDSLQEASIYLKKFKQAAKNKSYEELQAFELQNAIASLESIIGHIDNEEVLENIFRSFCIGK
jgi:tRNA modification GTPase